MTIHNIINTVCSFRKVNESEVFRRTRKRYIKETRQIIHYFCIKYNIGCSEKIGQLTGGLDRTTVLHSCKVIENYIETDKKFAGELSEIASILKEMNCSKKDEYVSNILKNYAEENKVVLRSTNDLSPFEQWLITRMYRVTILKNNENTTNNFVKSVA